jgi:hypothetical protein
MSVDELKESMIAKSADDVISDWPCSVAANFAFSSSMHWMGAKFSQLAISLKVFDIDTSQLIANFDIWGFKCIVHRPLHIV